MTRLVIAVVAMVVGLSSIGDAKPMPPPPAAPPRPVVEVISATAHDQTSLTTKAVRARIARSYAGGIKRCYERLLVAVPDAAGNVTFKFTVNPVGKVLAASARAFERSLTQCTTAQLKRWRFPIPQSTYAEPTSARFTVVMRLRLVAPTAPVAPLADDN